MVSHIVFSVHQPPIDAALEQDSESGVLFANVIKIIQVKHLHLRPREVVHHISVHWKATDDGRIGCEYNPNPLNPVTYAEWKEHKKT